MRKWLDNLGDLGGVFSQFFGRGGGGARTMSRRGADIQQPVEIILGCAPLAGRHADPRLLSDLAPPSHRPDDSAGRLPGPRIIPSAGGAFGPLTSPGHPKCQADRDSRGRPAQAAHAGTRWQAGISWPPNPHLRALANPVLKIRNGMRAASP